MVELDEHALHAIDHGGESLLISDVVDLIERYHPHEQPGVSREIIMRYAEALKADREEAFDMGTFRDELDGKLTDSETWDGKFSLYELESGRISKYPGAWHERLGGTTDIREYIKFLEDDAPKFDNDFGRGGPGPGVPEQPLLNVVAIVGGIDREEAKANLQDLRDEGEVTEDADQHPNAGVTLSERKDEYRDTSLDG